MNPSRRGLDAVLVLFWSGVVTMLAAVAVVTWEPLLPAALRGSAGKSTRRPAPLALPTPVLASVAQAPVPAVTPSPQLPPNARPAPAPGEPALPPSPDPTALLAQEVSRPVELTRSARDPQAQGRFEQQQAADTATLARQIGARLVSDAAAGTVEYEDAQGRKGRAELRRAAVHERDLGLAFLPGGRVDPEQAWRVQDNSGGVMVAVVLDSPETPERALAFYRSQLVAAGAGSLELDANPEPGQVLLQSYSAGSGARHAVLVRAAGAGSRITLVRSQAATR